MNEHPLRAADFIEHMIEAIDRIQTYTRSRTLQDFEKDTLLQDAVLRNFTVLGEAAKNFRAEASEEAQKHPEVPFAKIYAMRNQIEHGYFTVDLEITWNVIVHDLPMLRAPLEAVLERLSSDPGE